MTPELDIPSPHLDQHWKRGQELLGVRYPIMCGAMTWVSDPQLVSTVCNSGGFASLACGNMSPEQLRVQIDETRKLTDKPFAVNLITIAPNYRDLLEVTLEASLPVVVFAAGLPSRGDIDRVKESGAKVIVFASTDSLARRMIKYGVDGLILEGMEAGGHIGPVVGVVLWQQILFQFRDQVPIFIAGGIATGELMAHLLLMGASGVQLGTRFVMTDECSAHDNFKHVFQRARARDARASPQFDSRLPVIPVRALKNKGNEEFGRLQLSLIHKLEEQEISREAAQLEVERFWIGALRKAAVEGEVDRGSLMAGQVVGLADEIKSVASTLEELVVDGEKTMTRLSQALGVCSHATT